MKPFPIFRRRDPLTTSFVSVPTSCTKNGDERTAMRRKTGCILKRRSWVQFSGEQELDSAGNLGMSVLVGAKERRGWSLEKGLFGGLNGGISSAG